MNETDQAVLEFIIEYKREHDGNSPSMRDICDAMEGGVTSTSHVAYILDNLEQEGFVRLTPKNSRMIEVVGGEWTPPTLPVKENRI